MSRSRTERGKGVSPQILIAGVDIPVVAFLSSHLSLSQAAYLLHGDLPTTGDAIDASGIECLETDDITSPPRILIYP